MTNDLDALLVRVNSHRRAGDVDATVEDRLEQRFGCSHRLAVYGTLRRGASNHHVVAALAGTWHDGVVHGTLHPTGWGATYGYPGLQWEPSGAEVAVELLVSPELPAHWPRLDAFEGTGYLRILVSVRRAGEAVVVANLYEAQPSGYGDD